MSEVSRVVRFIDTENRRVGVRGWMGRTEESLFNGEEFQFGKMEKFRR